MIRGVKHGPESSWLVGIITTGSSHLWKPTQHHIIQDTRIGLGCS